MDVDSPEDLYGLPLDRFVLVRAELVKVLRGEKRREEAREVAALRKPSVAAWAVNQLVRTQPKGLQALFEAGDELARGQAQAAAGKGGGDTMRGASHRQRDAMRVLLEAAEGLLSSEGEALSRATMERVSETLRAAAVDEEARRQVAGGCLTQELRFVGVGIGGLTAPSTKRVRGAGPISTKVEKARSRDTDAGDTRPTPEDEMAAGARQAEAEREAARRQAAALKAARRTEAEARRTATRAHKELAAAQVRHEAAAASLAEAETLLSTSARRAEDAAASLAAAEQALMNAGRP